MIIHLMFSLVLQNKINVQNIAARVSITYLLPCLTAIGLLSDMAQDVTSTVVMATALVGHSAVVSVASTALTITK